jgi:hypothetical protein
MTTIGSKYRGTKQFLRVYSRLISAAEKREFVYYEEVAAILGIREPGHHMAREVGQVLGEISEDEVRLQRPMLSSVAVASRGEPGEGFFKLAKRLGKVGEGDDDAGVAFWRRELEEVYREWGS